MLPRTEAGVLYLGGTEALCGSELNFMSTTSLSSLRPNSGSAGLFTPLNCSQN